MNFDWSIYLQLSPDGQHTYLQTILNGLVWTLATALSAWIMALLFGTIVGTIRTTPSTWAVRLGNAYVELFRNIPLLVQMFLWFFVLPELLPTAAGDWLKQLPNASFVTAVVCLAFFTSARVAEQIRAGILSLPRGKAWQGRRWGSPCRKPIAMSSYPWRSGSLSRRLPRNFSTLSRTVRWP